METKRLSSLLKLIANPDRMTILFMLMDSERSIAELSRALLLAGATEVFACVVACNK